MARSTCVLTQEMFVDLARERLGLPALAEDGKEEKEKFNGSLLQNYFF